MSEWISVDDRLPEIFEPVLVMRCGSYHIAALFEEAGEWESGLEGYYYWDDNNFDGQGWEYDEVTHWQPLPSPPEGT